MLQFCLQGDQFRLLFCSFGLLRLLWLGGAEPGDFEADLVLFEGGSGPGSSEPPLDLVLFGMF